MYKSLKAGKIECLKSVQTIADGIAVKEPGENTFAIASEYVDDVVLVSDDEVASAILALIEKQKMIAEGAGAVSVAAAMFGKFPLQGKKVVCVISGGNIDVTSLSRVINRGLMKSGRTATLRIELMDKPGMLKDVTNIIAEHGGNVTGVHHDRGRSENINECILRIDLETRNYDHIEEILEAMRKQGIKVTLG